MSGTATATAVIAAAGSGKRLGAGGPKAFAELAGRPLLAWSLAALRAAESISAIIVAAPAGAEESAAAICGPGVRVVAGGAQRSQSVAAALELVESEIVVVHDAARPLASPQLFDEAVATLAGQPDADAVIAAAPLTDTIKRSREPGPGDGHGAGPAVAETIPRENLWAAQTPQVFRAAKLREALGADPKRLETATDDAMLIEQAGGRVLIHPAPAENIKVTTPFDFELATRLLEARDA